MHWQFGNHWFHRITCNCHLLREQKIIIFIKLITDLIIKIINYWEIQSRMTDTSFPKLYFLLENSVFFITGNKYIVVFLEATVYLHWSSRNFPCTAVWMPQLVMFLLYVLFLYRLFLKHFYVHSKTNKVHTYSLFPRNIQYQYATFIFVCMFYGTFIKISVPTLMPCYHPKPILYMRVPLWYCTPYRFW